MRVRPAYFGVVALIVLLGAVPAMANPRLHRGPTCPKLFKPRGGRAGKTRAGVRSVGSAGNAVESATSVVEVPSAQVLATN